MFDFGVTEDEQRASYAEQEKKYDNDISSDNQGGKKPKLWPGERKRVHTLVYHLYTDVNAWSGKFGGSQNLSEADRWPDNGSATTLS